MRAVQKLAGILLFVEVLYIWLSHSRGPQPLSAVHYLLLTRYVAGKAREGAGGVWYIPPDWIADTADYPSDIIEAAELVQNRTALSQTGPFLSYSSIPLVGHQKWKNTNPSTWSETLRRGTEKWLQYAQDDGAAYFLWDDDGVAQFIEHFEPDLRGLFYTFPNKAEQSDVFRVLLAKWIGGIYADMDTEPLRTTSDWITASDLEPWSDSDTGIVYNSTEPIKATVGLRAVCPPTSDMYWRMGYAYPIQLTQWAFAFRPGHPILRVFLDNLVATMEEIAGRHGGDLLSVPAQKELGYFDPLELTGPAAFTIAVRQWLESVSGLRWEALGTDSELSMYPAISFMWVGLIGTCSPGRGWYGNMGSKPVMDPSARLAHHAQGSWRTTSLAVEYGKFCRTVFGLCRDWSKVPHNLLW
ncbi:hypothetical protein BDW74DRAFT_164764 [Aspergillus multicolor]|uniref:uncharacterized protein n=1 Tax=Aspergillus multicolor TaxID=41759 RepID=UPI003CCCF04E